MSSGYVRRVKLNHAGLSRKRLPPGLILPRPPEVCSHSCCRAPAGSCLYRDFSSIPEFWVVCGASCWTSYGCVECASGPAWVRRSSRWPRPPTVIFVNLPGSVLEPARSGRLVAVVGPDGLSGCPPAGEGTGKPLQESYGSISPSGFGHGGAGRFRWSGSRACGTDAASLPEGAGARAGARKPAGGSPGGWSVPARRRSAWRAFCGKSRGAEEIRAGLHSVRLAKDPISSMSVSQSG